MIYRVLFVQPALLNLAMKARGKLALAPAKDVLHINGFYSYFVSGGI